jgi:predicted nucleic acid-binding Zn ribbon protein
MVNKIYNTPKPLGTMMETIVKELGLDDEYNLQQIEKIWLNVVGDIIARSARVKKIKSNKLFIETKSSTWRTELFLRRDNIINQINEQYGKTLVKELIIH